MIPRFLQRETCTKGCENTTGMIPLITFICAEFGSTLFVQNFVFGMCVIQSSSLHSISNNWMHRFAPIRLCAWVSMQIPFAAEHDLKMNMSLTSPFVACPCCYCSQLKAEAEHVDTFCIQWFPLRVRAACSQFRGPKRQP